MRKILVPVDDSNSSLHAVEHAGSIARDAPQIELHLLNVQLPMPTGVHAYLSADKISELEDRESDRTLQRARSILDGKGIPYIVGRRVGMPAQEIAEYARQEGCDCIVMGTHGRGTLGTLVMGTVAAKVVHLVHVPVTLIK